MTRHYVTVSFDFRINQNETKTITASEQANISFPDQVMNGVETTEYKILSLDGSCTVDGTYHPADKNGRVEMGWWGSQLSNSEGYFSEPFPSLTITFEEPHTFSTLRIVGDTAREEYPVNFAIKLYTGSTIETISVNGNTSVVYQQEFKPVDNVSKVVLEIYKWSHPNRQVKITEFVITFIVNFSDEDVFSLYIERELTGRTLPGSIETAEAKIELFNKDRRFDEDNVNSRYRAYLKPHKKVTLYIAEKAEKQDTVITQTLGTFWTTEWESPLQDLATTVKAQNLARVFEDVYYYQDTVETNKTVRELVTDVLLSTNLVTSSQIDIDSAVANEVIPLVVIGKMNVREILQKLAQAFGCVVLIDKDNKIHFKHLNTITAQSSVAYASSTNTYKMDIPARRDLYSIVRVQTSSFILGGSEKLFEKTLTGTAGTNTYKIEWEGAADPSTVTVTISNGPADLTYSVVETKPYGCVVIVTSYETSFTFDILIQGQRYETKGGAIIELQDATLVKDIGEVVLEIKDNPFLQTEAQAQSLANLLLSLYTIPRYTLQFEWAGNVTLDVGDVIDLITPLRTFKGFITKIEWDYDPTEVQTIEARRWE
jgi:hypothetical protein